jgi:DNA-binding transcriptional ArsR family regulator
MISTLFAGKTKAKIIKLLYFEPEKRYHMRQIQRLVKERINSVRGALLSLAEAGVINKERVGRKLLFWANSEGKYYDELLRVVNKQTGLGRRIINEKQRFGKIKVAFLTSNFYRPKQHKENEIDLFVIGIVSMAELAKVCAEEGKRKNWEINYSVMTPEEFAFRQKNKDPFLSTILQKNRLVLVGKEEQLF